MAWDEESDELIEAKTEVKTEVKPVVITPKIESKSIKIEENEDVVLKSSEKESILLFSQPKTGKTWAACSFIEKTVKNKGKVFYINTDSGLWKTFNAYFKDKAEEMKKSVNYYFIADLDNLDGIIKEIRAEVNENDLVVIDLIDDFWEKAQIKVAEDIADKMGISVMDYMILANKEDSKIGGLSADKWVLIKRYDNLIINSLVISPKCNVIACCSAKDIEMAKVFSRKDPDKMYELSKYEEIGSRPAGQKLLATKFNTIVYIGEKRDGKRFFIHMGDRGFIKTRDKVEYEGNFYEAFMKGRK